MRAAAAVVALVFACAAVRAEDVAPGNRAFLETVADKDACFVGESVRVRLRFGVDRVFFREHAVQPFQQRLDVPVHVATGPTLSGPSNGYVWPPADPKRFTFVLDARIASASKVEDVARNGRTFDVFEVARTVRFDRPGDYDVAADTMSFEFAERFDDDFVHERVPIGRRGTNVHGSPFVLHVRALPTEGRPAEFAGAIGRFDVAATADRGEAGVGETLKVTLVVSGAGNLQAVEAPRPVLAGFHVYGAIETKTPPTRTFVYDVAPTRDDVTEVPPIAFAYFDPDAGAYRVAKTAAIPLHVRPSPTAPTQREIARRNDHADAPRVLIVVFSATAVLLVVFIVWRGTRRPRAEDVGTSRVRDAAAAFRARGDADAFVAFLAACLDCAPAAVVSPDLAPRLAAAGVPSDVAARAASLVERSVAARYGGDAASGDADAMRVVVGEIESALG